VRLEIYRLHPVECLQEDVRLFIVWGEAELSFAGEMEEKKKRAGWFGRPHFFCATVTFRVFFLAGIG
jgi:hypothetical protein